MAASMVLRTLSSRILLRSNGLKSITQTLQNKSKRCMSARPTTGQAASMMDIGTREIFSEEHDIFRQNVRRFFQEEVAPHHTQWEKDGQVSREVWEKAGSNGLLGVNTPAEMGGIGGDVLSTVITWEEQVITQDLMGGVGTKDLLGVNTSAEVGRKGGDAHCTAITLAEQKVQMDIGGGGLHPRLYVNCSGPGFGLHSDIVMPYITHYGSQEQVEKFIPRMVAGTCIGAIAMSEPGAGSDLQGIRTNAKKDGDDYILNGSKVFITNGWMSDVVLTVAITNPQAKSAAHGISLFLVEDGMKGFVKGRKLEKLGFKAQDTAELFFEDVRLPKSALLGEENNGFYYLMKELPQERLIIAAMAIASCEWMFEETRNYVKQRKAFGKTLSNLQTIQHKLAELKTEICIARSFIDDCLRIHNERGLDSSSASMAKYWCSDLQNSVATRCLQMFGGWGYMWEYPIAKAFVDARVQPIYGGSNEIMKELIARQIISDK